MTAALACRRIQGVEIQHRFANGFSGHNYRSSGRTKVALNALSDEVADDSAVCDRSEAGTVVEAFAAARAEDASPRTRVPPMLHMRGARNSAVSPYLSIGAPTRLPHSVHEPS